MARLPATNDVIQALRRPTVIFTDAYLNDPIEFNPDGRFVPSSVVEQRQDLTVVSRDEAEFNVVTLNTPLSQILCVPMYHQQFHRQDLYRTIDKTFKQLGVDRDG
jgi:hypothetical protein